jgi:Fe2+ transport system protein B
MVKEDEEALKTRKSSPELKVAASKKRKIAALKPEATELEEETPSTPSAAEVEDILKVMTESLPVKLLSPLRPQLTKLLQKKDELSAEKKAVGRKKQTIVTVMHAIEETPPPASRSKITLAAEAAPPEATTVEAATSEATNLESTLSDMDKMLLDMATE